ncbi:hypothetical protein ACFU0X_10530 [Streptomyces cellulosae]|uniref:Uncharacterized protein n=1 Tax=Streptomyces cellulosae TaxID=1968 RepID=A0ABW6JDN2_STRCE
MTTSIAVPDISVPRYKAPQVATTPVTEVIPSEPVSGNRAWPGQYQHIVLNTRTGQLYFHESDEHRTPWNPAWKSFTDVPDEIRSRWHPGALFLPGDNHALFKPVPAILYWVIDSGVDELPYLDVDAANEILAAAAPFAQELLDNLYDVEGDLDWSAASWIAGRNLNRGLSRHRDPLPQDADIYRDVADYADVIARYPEIYQPELTTLSLEEIADHAETIVRFLGCNEHWHPQVLETFGCPDRTGYVCFTPAGVRAWYRAAALYGGPLPGKPFSVWDAEHGRLASGEITATTSDDELTTWAAKEEERAAREGFRLLDVREAAIRHRDGLRAQAWERGQAVRKLIETLQDQLRPLIAERASLINDAIGWGRGDSEIAAQVGVTRQAVHQARQRLTEQIDDLT